MRHSRVILVDADRTVRLSTVSALQAEGFEVTCHESAEALLADADLRNSACIILDHRLPGVNGLALLGQLRARRAASPAIVTVTNPSPAFCRQVSQAQGRVLEKPLLGDRLVSAIRELTGSQPTGQLRAATPEEAPWAPNLH